MSPLICLADVVLLGTAALLLVPTQRKLSFTLNRAYGHVIQLIPLDGTFNDHPFVATSLDFTHTDTHDRKHEHT
jgi:hypothetical protein